MAKRNLLSFISEESLNRFLSRRPSHSWGRVEQGIDSYARDFCRELCLGIETKFREDPDFVKAGPVFLGSLARNEVCPESDIDILFLGDTESAGNFIRRQQECGLRIRARIPESLTDLTDGVATWDILGLMQARPLTEGGAQILGPQIEKLRKSSVSQKKKWARELRQERAARELRFQGVQNLLEPNLKYSRGGLRDLEQGLQVFDFLKNQNLAREQRLLIYYKDFFLWLRLLAHIHGHRDLLSADLQMDLAEALGFSDYRQMMFFLQRGFSRVSFYTDWILEETIRPSRQEFKFERPLDLVKVFDRDSSVQMQHLVRSQMDNFWPVDKISEMNDERKASLRWILNREHSDQIYNALFRSRLMDRIVPELKPLVGYVQHDHYHRWTADAHLLQTLKISARSTKRLKEFYSLRRWVKELESMDWRILRWASLYHDLGKGREGVAHEELGARWAERDINQFGLGTEFAAEVAWIVENHLILSQAAFRKDSSSETVLQGFLQRNMSSRRLIRLAAFTAIDIQATNPESWNQWKAQLLDQLIQKINSPEFLRKKKLTAFLKRNELLHEQEVVFRLAALVGVESLLKDLRLISKDGFRDFQMWRVGGATWIRYASESDRPGSLARALGFLFQAGASVVGAEVQSLNGKIYDWFSIQFEGRADRFMQRLRLIQGQKLGQPPLPNWSKVTVLDADQGRMSLVFHGKDRRGILWATALGLTSLGFQIQSAQAHTWGDRVEDIFVVIDEQKRSKEQINELIRKLFQA